ncbi:cytochrome P450 [Microbacterium sp. Root61]|uniref:cytochrome P450 n=1 Tax=Microbacterium sp. Root61 TaxID=1736570 RepID=UPI000AF03F76|nr:cytochrome P450 [Microbacterium sp. Root61]
MEDDVLVPDATIAWTTRRAPGDRLAPPPEFAEIQRSGAPMGRVRIWDDSEPWLVTTYDEYRQVTSDQRFSADKSRPGFPLKNAGYQSKARTFLQMDDPEHLPYRRLFARHLSAARMEALRPQMQQIVDDLIDAMLAKPQPADLVADFALPVPALILGAVFGVPAEDREGFLDLASTMSSAHSTPEQTAQAMTELRAYSEKLVAAREIEPQDDLISRFLEDGVRGGVMTRSELISEVTLLVSAAHDTSTSLIALGTLALLNNPEQLALLQENSGDAKFVSNATEELLRFVSPAQTGRRRIATEDLELNGQIIRKGEGVIALDHQSSRDPKVFLDPDRLDLQRPEARRHNALGFGTHQCAGQSLARVELQVVFSTLYRRLPNLALAVPEAELPFREDTIIYNLDAMPISW